MRIFLFTHGSFNQINNIGKKGNFIYQMKIPKNIFNTGEFIVDFGCVYENKFYFLKENYLSFTVNNKAKEIGSYFGVSKGGLKLNLEWKESILEE